MPCQATGQPLGSLAQVSKCAISFPGNHLQRNGIKDRKLRTGQRRRREMWNKRSKWLEESERWWRVSALALRNFKSLANKETSGWGSGENIKLSGRILLCHFPRQNNFLQKIQPQDGKFYFGYPNFSAIITTGKLAPSLASLSHCGTASFHTPQKISTTKENAWH